MNLYWHFKNVKINKWNKEDILEYQLINLDGIMELDYHYLATTITVSRKNH